MKDAGVSPIANALKTNSKLTSINLGGSYFSSFQFLQKIATQIGPDGVADLSKGIQNNKGLKLLNLMGTN